MAIEGQGNTLGNKRGLEVQNALAINGAFAVASDQLRLNSLAGLYDSGVLNASMGGALLRSAAFLVGMLGVGTALGGTVFGAGIAMNGEVAKGLGIAVASLLGAGSVGVAGLLGSRS